jgi:4'-phosphopantetheinyl transferase
LSPDEKARHDRFRFTSDRREFALAHALLRTTLSRCLDRPPSSWSFRTDHGKPILEPPSLSFNLSHTKGLVACAVTVGCEVGVDVEAIDRPAAIDRLAARYFSSAEIGQLAACQGAARSGRFFEIWTLKEAFAKALGLGLAHPLNATTFDLTRPGVIELTECQESAVEHSSAAESREQWRFRLVSPTPRYRLAVAARSALPLDIVVREWSGE